MRNSSPKGTRRREIVGFIATASQPGIHEPGKSCADSRPVRREHRLVGLLAQAAQIGEPAAEERGQRTRHRMVVLNVRNVVSGTNYSIVPPDVSDDLLNRSPWMGRT